MEGNHNDWSSRRLHLMAVLCQTIGINTFIYQPHEAVALGAVGHIAAYFLTYILIGIPLLYVEYVVGQFTTRDCLDVWKARSIFSHIGYIHIFWQIIFVIYCHTVNSFVLHYFLISFENPIPFYECGNWSTPDCDILTVNYTINQDCVRQKDPEYYCANIFSTFPEYQYWRYQLLGLNQNYYHVAWRVNLASGIICVVMFISCFKRTKYLRWVLGAFAVYPLSVSLLLMMGSMVQKGVVLKFEEAMDTNFNMFMKNFDLTYIVAEVMYALNVGTGLSFNLASSTSFRSPTYSNVAVAVVVSGGVLILTICNLAMMSCPYAYEFGVRANSMLKFSMTNSFEKIPRLLSAYKSRTFWLIINYSCLSASATGINTLYLSGLLEMVLRRHPKISRYPGLAAFTVMISLYFITIPLLGNISLYLIVDLKRTYSTIILLIVIVESAVFVFCYGFDKLSEDVHFMQGTQPRNSVKAGWGISSLLLVYVFFVQSYKHYLNHQQNSIGGKIGSWLLVCTVLWIFLVILIRILIALCKKKVYDLVRLDPTWGPKDEVLKRSRAMFTAQAMTKEYMYRQYHLQAGIQARQRRSNVRGVTTSGSRA